jgi:hypothetical protein
MRGLFLPLAAGLFGLALALAMTGCGDYGSDPGGTEPPPPEGRLATWDDGVGDLLERECSLCHSDPPALGAPGGFRLDRYDGAAAGGGLLGAYEKRDRIAARSVAGTSMPSGGPLSDADRAYLQEWIDAGAPER